MYARFEMNKYFETSVLHSSLLHPSFRVFSALETFELVAVSVFYFLIVRERIVRSCKHNSSIYISRK